MHTVSGTIAESLCLESCLARVVLNKSALHFIVHVGAGLVNDRADM